jgi:starch phosphorylase
VTGWAVGTDGDTPADAAQDADALYDKLERVVIPLVNGDPGRYAALLRSVVSLTPSYFNTHRMLAQYMRNAYRTAVLHLGPATGAQAPPGD